MKRLFISLLAVMLFILTALMAECHGAGITVVGELTHEKALEPGGSFEGVILLKNRENTPSEVKIYQTDYLFYSDGKNIYGEPGKDPRSNAPWITITPTRLTVPPGENARISYKITVPGTPGLTGTYWSLIMVEPISAASPESVSPEKGKVKVGLQSNMRYAIQMVTQIGDTGTVEMAFGDKKIITSNKERILQIDQENRGERSVIPHVWAELYEKAGTHVGKFDAGRLRINPRCSGRFRINITDLPKGEYKAIIIVDCGEAHVFGGEYNFQLK